MDRHLYNSGSLSALSQYHFYMPAILSETGSYLRSLFLSSMLALLDQKISGKQDKKYHGGD
jgi:hypothetical protein